MDFYLPPHTSSTEDKHAFIAHTLSQLDHKLTPGLALFAALYLIGHGAIKVFFGYRAVAAAYSNLYLLAIIFLLLLIFYQSSPGRVQPLGYGWQL